MLVLDVVQVNPRSTSTSRAVDASDVVEGNLRSTSTSRAETQADFASCDPSVYTTDSTDGDVEVGTKRDRTPLGQLAYEDLPGICVFSTLFK